jgi:dTDP-4-amino-4,6-dideoxygalactose transaminase
MGPAANSPVAPALEPHPDERWPYYAEDEIEAVAAVLRSGRVNQWTGPEVFEFEQACAERFGGGRAIALANGSVALELALRAFGIGPGDEVIVSPRSFVASASCASLVGAVPIFADVDPDSGNITPDSVSRVLTERTRAIIPVHLAGWPADVPGLMELVHGGDVKVIEDCAQAHGAEIDGESVGSFGDAAAFSFCQDKIISTGGEGGLLTIKDASAWDWAWSFVYPSERHCVPRWLMEELLERLHDQADMKGPGKKVCRGRIFSPRDYAIDVDEWGFSDAVGNLEEQYAGGE